MTLRHGCSLALPAITGIATALLLGCSSGSGSGGGGGLSVNEKAAAAAFGGAFIALDARDFAGQVGDDDDDEGGIFDAASAVMKSARVVAKSAEPCSDGGSLSEEAGTAESLYAGTITTERVVAVNCKQSIPQANFSAETDGIIEFGEAENGAVFFFKASGASGDPDNGDQYTSVTNAPGFSSDIKMRGLMNICDGCSAPQEGGNLEQEVFLDARFLLEGSDFTLQFGRRSDEPLRFVGTTSGNTGTGTIDGLLAVNVAGTPCAFSADYETVEPLAFEGLNGNNERIVGGVLNVAIDGGSPIEVVFQEDGSLIVDGETYTEADLDALDEECGFAE